MTSTREHRQRPGSARWLWPLIGAAGLALACGAASAAYQRAGDRHDQRQHPPPGRIVDTADGPRHVWIMGSGAPAVVVLPCLGGPAVEWARVGRELAQHTTVVLYDRAGVGWSAPVQRRNRSIADMVVELRAVLDEVPVPGPHVLVGHSIGGLIARLYASRHRRDVAGLVLVDSSHERMDEHLERYDPTPWYIPHRRWDRSMRERLRWLGVSRLLYDTGRRPDVRTTEERNHVPDDLVDASVAFSLATSSSRADAAELAGLQRGFREVTAGAHHLGDLPLTVVTGGAGDHPQRQRWWNPGWLELQDELVAQSDRVRQVRADHTGHHVHRDDPDLVVRAVTEAVDELR